MTPKSEDKNGYEFTAKVSHLIWKPPNIETYKCRMFDYSNEI